MNTRQSISILFVGVSLILSCSKSRDTVAQPVATAGVEDHTPALPLLLYSYTTASLPAFITQYIQANPVVDATPPGNSITDAGATLGRVLFYDNRLSVNNTVSCASCHHQSNGFSDTVALSTGFAGGLTRRNAMTAVNLRYFAPKKMFWDLRAADLEAQTLQPIQNTTEMGITSLAALETKLAALSYYPALFRAAFGSTEVTSDRISRALSQFLRSIVSFGSKYDQGLGSGFSNFSASELRGLGVARRAFCMDCHSDLTKVQPGQNATFLAESSGLNNNGRGTNNGLDLVYADNGIGEISGLPQDQGTFKVPSLRNIELTAPYMHDGRFKTLQEAIEHYSSGIKAHSNKGNQLPAGGFHFTELEKSDLLAFLKTLTDPSLAADVRFSDPFSRR